MKTVFMKSLNEIEFRDIALPGLDLHEARVRVDACGVCGTDITSALDGRPEAQTIGHEVAATVLEVGAGVTRVAPGQKVVLDSSSACGECDHCKNRRQDLCTNVISFFFKPYLGFAEEMLTPAISCVAYKDLSPEAACLAEPLGVSIDMTLLGQIELGSHVVVSGIGAIGLMAIRLAKMSGAERVYACSPSHSKAKIEAALKFGADEIIEIDKTDLATYKFAQAPDRFLVTSPPVTIPPMVQAAATGAIISYVGIKYGDGANITFDANDFHFKKLQLRGSFASPAMYTPMAVRLLENGSIDAKTLITHVFEMKDIAEALKVATTEKAKAIKVVLVNR